MISLYPLLLISYPGLIIYGIDIGFLGIDVQISNTHRKPLY